MKSSSLSPGLEVIKLEYSLRLQIALYFESENELKFYNPEARSRCMLEEYDENNHYARFDSHIDLQMFVSH